MIDKKVSSVEEAVEPIGDGSTILVGGFGDIGVPMAIVEALARKNVKNLTLVCNNAGVGTRGLALLFQRGMISKLLASFPAQSGADEFLGSFRRGEVDVQLVPQGTLAERIRAGGAGIAGFFTPTGFGTELAKGKETRAFDGKGHVFEHAIKGDFALIRADVGDRFGNLRYRLASRNFNPVMATAVRCTIAEVRKFVALGEINPDDVHTPGVYVDRLVEVPE